MEGEADVECGDEDGGESEDGEVLGEDRHGLCYQSD